MSKRKVTTYTSEFRENAIKLALESDQPVSQTANNLGINHNTLMAIEMALSQYIVFIPENGDGVGVRLKKTE